MSTVCHLHERHRHLMWSGRLQIHSVSDSKHIIVSINSFNECHRQLTLAGKLSVNLTAMYPPVSFILEHRRVAQNQSLSGCKFFFLILFLDALRLNLIWITFPDA